jgi:hypothetical protein
MYIDKQVFSSRYERMSGQQFLDLPTLLLPDIGIYLIPGRQSVSAQSVSVHMILV